MRTLIRWNCEELATFHLLRQPGRKQSANTVRFHSHHSSSKTPLTKRRRTPPSTQRCNQFKLMLEFFFAVNGTLLRLGAQGIFSADLMQLPSEPE